MSLAQSAECTNFLKIQAVNTLSSRLKGPDVISSFPQQVSSHNIEPDWLTAPPCSFMSFEENRPSGVFLEGMSDHTHTATTSQIVFNKSSLRAAMAHLQFTERSQEQSYNLSLKKQGIKQCSKRPLKKEREVLSILSPMASYDRCTVQFHIKSIIYKPLFQVWLQKHKFRSV